MANQLAQQNEQDIELTPGQALQYMGELISEYMKTLPIPVRAPVIAMVNQASAVVGQALNENLGYKMKEKGSE